MAGPKNNWRAEAGASLLPGLAKEKSEIPPAQRKLLEALRKAQMQAERASYFRMEPDPALLAFIKEAEAKLAAMQAKRNRPKRTTKKGQVISGTGVVQQHPVPKADLDREEQAELQAIAATLKVYRESETRTDIVEALRIMSVAAMPRTRKEAQAGTYHVIWPMAADRWCRASVTGDEGREVMWGKDRVWMRVIQTWIADALRADPTVRKIVFPSYRSILARMGMSVGGTQTKQIAEAMQRMSDCTWRFDFARTRQELEDLDKKPSATRPKAIRFILVTRFNLPSRKDVEAEENANLEPLPMGEGEDNEPYFIQFPDDVAVALMNPKELHILPMLLLQKAANEPLTLDFWDFCVQAAKRLSNPWEVKEEYLLAVFGKGRGKDGAFSSDQRKNLFSELDVALAKLVEALAPQFHAEFRTEPLPRQKGQRGPTRFERRLVIYPLRGPIEYLPSRKATLKG